MTHASWSWTLAIFITIGGVSCSGKTDKSNGSSATAANGAGHLARHQAKRLFPKTLGTFAMSAFKIKPKSDAWVEYKGDYVRGTQLLKLVINDYPPNGNPAWAAKLAAGNDEVAGHTALLEAKSTKVTLMVGIKGRYRVDFKSRTMTGSQIKEVASQFDFERLARTTD